MKAKDLYVGRHVRVGVGPKHSGKEAYIVDAEATWDESKGYSRWSITHKYFKGHGRKVAVAIPTGRERETWIPRVVALGTIVDFDEYEAQQEATKRAIAIYDAQRDEENRIREEERAELDRRITDLIGPSDSFDGKHVTWHGWCDFRISEKALKALVAEAEAGVDIGSTIL
jgi:hypothetical protein